MSKKGILIIGLVAGFALGLITLATVFRLDSDVVEKIRANETTILTIDAESMEPVEVEISFSNVDLPKPEYLNFPYQIVRIQKGMTRIMWLDSEEYPVTPVASADGYSPVKVSESNSIWWGGGTAMAAPKTIKLQRAQQVAAGNGR